MPMTVYVAMPHGAKMHILSRARGAGRKGWVRWTTRCGLTRDWNMADHPVRLPREIGCGEQECLTCKESADHDHA